MASALAFNAMFAIVPMLLLAGGIVGLVAQNPEAQQEMIDALAGLFPPLEPVFADMVNGLAQASASLSIIGLVGAAWGTTRFYAALEDTISFMFSDVPRRGVVRKTIRRIASAFLITGVPIILVVGSVLLSLVPGSDSGGILDRNGIVARLIPLVVLIGVVAATYRYVPPVRPGWPAVRLPAVLVGTVLLVGTNIFMFIAPRLIGANAVSGTLGALFIALTWLGLTFTGLLLGAAWTRERMLRAERQATPEPPPEP